MAERKFSDLVGLVRRPLSPATEPAELQMFANQETRAPESPEAQEHERADAHGAGSRDVHGTEHMGVQKRKNPNVRAPEIPDFQEARNADPQEHENANTRTSVPPGARNYGRPHGKRTHPDWEHTNLLLQKRVKKLANRKREDERTDKDLSELVNRLLARYVAGEIS